MATMSIPDGRKVPNYALIEDAPLNASPQFPFRVYPANGFFELDPQVLTNPPTYEEGSVEVVLTPNFEWHGGHGGGWDTIIGAVAAENVLIFADHLAYYANGFNDESTSSESYNCTLLEGKKYRFVFYASDATSFGVDIYDEGSGQYVGGCSLTGLGTRVGDPVVTLGYPPDAHLAVPVDGGAPYVMEAANGLVIHSVSRMQLPTALALFPVGVEQKKAGARRAVARFITTHDNLHEGFRYELTAGAGDTDNGLFTISRDQLYPINDLTAGVKLIRVEVKDKFGRSATFPLALGVGPQSGPTDITLDNTTIEAVADGPGVEIMVGTLTTTDTTPGDIFTYGLVSGEYSGQNEWYEIRGDELWRISDCDFLGTSYCRVQSTDALGQYMSKYFAITNADTTLPVITAFTVEDGSSYDVTVSAATATDTVGVVAYYIGMSNNTPPTYPDPAWTAEPPTTFTIPLGNQTGSGDYELGFWAIDSAGNMAAAVDTATLTIA